MVYQDYELVATKRVSHSRSKGSLLLKQQFNAMGGFYTVYAATFFGLAGTAFNVTSAPPLARPLMSGAGMASLARTGLIAGGPVLFGLIMGVNSFGNPTELRNLIWNAPTYRREFKAVLDEHYY